MKQPLLFEVATIIEQLDPTKFRKSMKTFALVILVMSVFVSCKEIEKLTEFNMNYDSSVTIESGTGLTSPLKLFTPDIETNSESEFAVNDTRKDMVEEIKLTKLDLTITSPEAQTFSFLKSISVFISAEGLSEVEIASQDNIPENIGSLLSLETTDQDLKEYIKKDKFVLRVKSVTDEVMSQDVDIDIASQFFVNAKVLGL